MIVKPYGDTLNDGAVQLSFTLPVKQSARAIEAARLFAQKLGFDTCEVVHTQALSEEFTFFVVYGKTHVSIDFDAIVADEGPQSDTMDMAGVNSFIEKNLGRKVVVVGACTGFDAHTVGIDAIMNMKGYNHHFGLERYSWIETHNMGAQVANERFIEYALSVNADALLVSQVVTQKDTHIQNLTHLIELLEAEKLRDRFVVVCGGPRLSNKLALELGYDAGFGRGTYAEHVASFVAKKMLERKQR